MKKLLLLPLILLLSVSCNELKQDKAPKKSINLIQAQSHPAGYKSNPEPDSVTMFLWPTEDFYNRQKAAGLVDQRDYQSFVADVAAEVFLSGDEFDEWSITQLTRGVELDEEITAINSDISAVTADWKKLKTEARNLSRKYKKECKATPDSEDCVSLKEEADEKMAEYKDADKKRKIMMRSRDELQDESDNITTNQAKKLARVQSALDPQATVWMTDDQNRRVVDYVNESKQVNWIKTYENYAGEKNLFDIQGGYINIIFGEFGNNAIEYKTVFKKNDAGDVVLNTDGSPVMLAESDFSRMILAGNNIYEFDMLEKDMKGNRTGRVFEFKVETSPFAKHLKILGDVVVKYEGKVVRRGQTKIILTKAE
ncbi:MAG: hypothetical protein KC493_08475 [Bacteriovoracaceae bacterium]|nr:hypothetical protein [Bacteriovoracaceae bacterium]